jgi:hypothetical protein
MARGGVPQVFRRDLAVRISTLEKFGSRASSGFFQTNPL